MVINQYVFAVFFYHFPSVIGSFFVLLHNHKKSN